MQILTSVKKMEPPKKRERLENKNEYIQGIKDQLCSCHEDLKNRRLTSPSTGKNYDPESCSIPLYKWPCCPDHSMFKVNIWQSCRCELCMDWYFNNQDPQKRKWNDHYNEITQNHCKKRFVRKILSNDDKLDKIPLEKLNFDMKAAGFNKQEKQKIMKKKRLLKISKIDTEEGRKLLLGLGTSYSMGKQTIQDSEFLDLSRCEFNLKIRESGCEKCEENEIRRRRRYLKETEGKILAERTRLSNELNE